MQTLIFTVPHTPEVTALIAELIPHGLKVDGWVDPHAFLTVKQAAKEASRTYSSINALVKSGAIKSSRPFGPGGDIRIRRADLWEFLAESPAVRGE